MINGLDMSWSLSTQARAFANMQDDAIRWDRENFPRDQQYWDTQTNQQNIESALVAYWNANPHIVAAHTVPARKVLPAIALMPTLELEQMACTYRRNWLSDHPQVALLEDVCLQSLQPR